MTKKVLLATRDEIVATVLAIADNRLGPDTQHEVREAINSGFASLLKLKPVTRALLVKQIGTAGYRVTRTTNLLDVPVGSMLTPEQTRTMQADGINVSVMRNS